MPLDKSFVEQNRASANRIRALSARLSDDELKKIQEIISYIIQQTPIKS